MDIKIFNELKNKGAITNPFITHTDFNDFEELITKGYVSGIGVKELYNSIITDNGLTNSFDEQIPEENINLDKTIINNIVDNVEETVAADNTEETVAADNTEETVAADNTEETVAADNTEEPVAADNVEETVKEEQTVKKTVKKTKKVE